jgi:hypothetical protein
MFRKTLMALAATLSLGFGAGAAFTPAMANYDFCTENPSSKGCPGNFDVTQEPFYVAPAHKAAYVAPSRKAAEHQPQHMTRHHG